MSEGAERLAGPAAGTASRPVPLPLAGKVSVVTGAGRGIGRAISLAFAKAGAVVVASGRSTDSLEATVSEILADGGEALALAADVREFEDVWRLASEVEARFGRTDLLIANSGVGGPTAPSWEVDPEQWNETIATNLTGVFLCCRAFLPGMIERKSGSIVVIGSVTGKRPMKGRVPYAASKLGAVGLVRTVAAEVGAMGVRVNLISPGATEGPRLEWAIREQAELSGRPYAEVEQKFMDESALRRPVSARDIADCAIFLSSESARSITGEDVNVAAGWVMY